MIEKLKEIISFDNQRGRIYQRMEAKELRLLQVLVDKNMHMLLAVVD